MKCRFRTKNDRNGNNFTLIFDTENKVYAYSYGLITGYVDFETFVRKKDIDSLRDALDKDGYRNDERWL